jgi:hypothetical protein
MRKFLLAKMFATTAGWLGRKPILFPGTGILYVQL